MWEGCFCTEEVDKWASDVCTFSGIASTQPQLAYSAVTRSLQHEWSFLLRVVPGCGALFQELELVLGSAFLPALFGVEISAVERDLFSLPLRMGDLAVVNPVTAAPQFYDSSLSSTASLVKFIIGVATFELDAHIETVSLSRDQG